MFKKLFLFLMLSITLLQATVATNSNVTQLYIANFDRAPDNAGLDYWVKESKLFLEEIATSFYDQKETQNMYPVSFTNEEFINAVYDNMFNRKPDEKGFDYWKKSLDDGLISRSLFILAVANGAQGDDEKILDNKTIVGLEFASSGNDNIQDAYKIMEDVTKDPKSVDNAVCEFNLDSCDSPESVPKLESFVGSVLESAEGWSSVGNIKIKTTGNKPISKITLSGDGYKDFLVDTKGAITVSISADFNVTTKSKYTLKAIATNDLGDSDDVDVNITVTTTEGNNTTPILENSTGTVYESSLVGASVGSVTIKSSGTSAIKQMVLTGTGSDNFVINTRGFITVASGASFDYATIPKYSLTAVATNSSGDSNKVTVVISVIKDGVEGAPKLQPSIGTVAENAVTGSRVGSVIVADSGTSTITSITLSGTGSSNFVVDTGTKIISVASGAKFDYDTTPKYSLQAVAKNSVGSSTPVSVIINVTKVSTNGVPILAPSTGSIAENAKEGAVVGKMTITNSGDSAIKRIYLSNFDKDSFTVDTLGNIKVSAYSKLDYESFQSYSLLATAVNSQGESTPVSLVISIIDIAEVNPTLSDTSLTVAEDAEANATVGDIKVKSQGDANITAFTLSGTGSDKFIVDSKGKIRVKASNSLDYESIPEYNLTAIASSSVGNSNSANVNIKVTNISDVVPTLSAFTGKVDENATIGTVVGSITITSIGDSPISKITLGGDTNSQFNVDTSGVIKVAKRLDFETNSSFVFSAIATNGAGDSPSVAVNIAVNNITEIVPVLGNSIGQVADNAIVGTKVADVNITSDGGAVISRIILGGTNSTDFVASIDGNVSVANGAILNYQTKPEYNLTVIAKNSVGDSNEANLTIRVTRASGLKPVLANSFGKIAENANVGDKVGDINITSVGNSNITDINLTGDGEGNFTVSPDGVIKVKAGASLDYAKKPLYALKAIATNSSGSSDEVDLNITIIDINENVPTLSHFIGSIDENATSKTIIGNIKVLSEGNSSITSYSFISANSNFDLNNTGTISLSASASLDYETTKKYTLQAKATNGAGDSNIIDVNISINNIIDLNATLAPFSGNVEENATTTMNLGQINITQGDSNITAINLTGSGEGNFTVTTSGIIKLSPNANIDYESGTTEFKLKAIAVNSSGSSSAVDVNLTITNIADVKASISGFVANVDENASSGTLVGQIIINSIGDSNITVINLSGTGSSDFVALNDGNVTLNSTLKYLTQSEYNLTAVAKNGAGDSNETNITISVIETFKPFITTWETNSTNRVIKIGTLSSIGAYDYNISWGDGEGNISITGDINHTYSTDKTFTVEINGTFPQLYMGDENTSSQTYYKNYTADRLKTITQWGTQKWKSMKHSFYRCVNMTLIDTVPPQLAGVTDMNGTFAYASKFNSDIKGWDFSTITNMSEMFMGATSFDQTLEAWKIGKVKNMSGMLNDTNLSVEHYSTTLIDWANNQVSEHNITLDANSSKYRADANASRDTLINTYKWIINDAGAE